MLHGLPAELWVGKDWHLNISYTADAGRVAIVHVRRPNRYDLEMIGAASSEASRNAPDLEKLNAAIGLAVDDVKPQAALARWRGTRTHGTRPGAAMRSFAT